MTKTLLMLAAVLSVVAHVGTAAATEQDDGPVVIRHSSTASAIDPGDVVEFVVTVVNTSADALNDVEIRAEPDAAVFTSPTADGGQVNVDGTISWSVPVLDPGETPFSYRATAADRFGPAASTTSRVVIVADGVEYGPSIVELKLAQPADALEVTHVPVQPNQVVGSGDAVDYRVVLRHTGSVAIRDVVVLVEPDPTVFVRVESQATRAVPSEGSLRWTVTNLAPGATEELIYTATADTNFPEERVSVQNQLTLTIDGISDDSTGPDVPDGRSDPLPLAGEVSDVDVVHLAVDQSTVVTQNETVAYGITVSNTSAISPVVDVSVRIETGTSEVFSTFEPLDGGEIDRNGNLVWTVSRLNPGDSTVLGYRATAKSSLGDNIRTVLIEGVVEVQGDEKDFSSKSLSVARPIERIAVEHRAAIERTLIAGETVEYTISVTNPNPDPVDGLTLTLAEDQAVFGAPENVEPVEFDGDADQTWKLESLAGRSTRTFTYTVTAKDDLPDRDQVVNTVSVSLGEESIKSFESDPIDLPESGDGSGGEATLTGPLLFVLTIIFLLITFLATGFLVISRSGQRADRMTSEIALNLFTIMSLLGATLILAFGTNLQKEALSLLAAIAGYALGRGVSASRSDGTIDDDGSTPSKDGVPPPRPDGPVATGLHEWRSARSERRTFTALLLVLPLVSPVFIVLATLWLLESSGTADIPWTTFLAASLLALLVVVIVAALAYLYSEATGPNMSPARHPDDEDADDTEGADAADESDEIASDTDPS